MVDTDGVKLVMSTCETHDQNSEVVGNAELQVKMKAVCVFVILVSALGAKCSLLWYLCTELPRDNLLVKQGDRHSDAAFLRISVEE